MEPNETRLSMAMMQVVRYAACWVWRPALFAGLLTGCKTLAVIDYGLTE